ncbi:MAG: hypothetical protein ABIA76_03740 [Candidatus Diapherotrites archaeon]
MDFKYLIVLGLLLAFSAGVFADFYLGYYDNGLSVEYWEGGNWSIASGYPYDFYYSNWYYTDSQWRVWNGANYYYYPAGWYDYSYFGSSYTDGAWDFDPYGGYYYSSNYYYYNGYWDYYPNWQAYYAPAYYGYYPGNYSYGYYGYPSNYNYSGNYGYNYNGYGYYSGNYGYSDSDGAFNSGDGIGNGYRYEQDSDCDKISVSAGYVSLNENQTKEFNFTASNYEEFGFEVNEVSLYIDSFNLSKEKISFDDEIKANKSGKINVKISAENNSTGENASAVLRIYGNFADGTSCNAEKEFTIRLNGTGSGNSNNNSGNSNSGYYNSAQEMPDYGYIPKSTWNEAPYSGEFEGEENNREKTKSKIYPTSDLISLSFSPGMNVYSGSNASKTFYLRNQSNSALQLEGIIIEPYGNKFNAMAELNDYFVPAKGYGGIKIELSADIASKASTETALITVYGYFKEEGESFSISRELPVKILAKEKAEFSEKTSQDFSEETEFFELTVPKNLAVEDEKDFAVYISNPYNKPAVIYLNAENAELNKTKITVEANSDIAEIIRISNVSENTRLEYSIRIPGIYMQKKFTEVIFIEPNEIEANAETEEQENAPALINSEAQENESDSNNSDFSNPTGFIPLPENAVNFGLIALILALGYVIYSKTKK